MHGTMLRGVRERASYAPSTARGAPIESDLRPYQEIVQDIRGLDLRRESDAELQRMARTVRERVGDAPDREIVPLFALATEASRRRLGIEPFDAQLVAAIAMHRGRLAQMQTGEGKTLAAVFPAALNAMSGRGVHVMTANDYLARRDAQWMGPVYEALGLHVASVGAASTRGERRVAYDADVVYLGAREAGFDYLRDQLCYQPSELVQRELFMAILDEADFILIDEARIPLVIAGLGDALGPLLPVLGFARLIAWVAGRLRRGHTSSCLPR